MNDTQSKALSRSKVLSRDDILKADDIKSVAVEIPEWGGFVYVTVMNGVQRGRFEMQMMDSREEGQTGANLEQARQVLAVACVTDAEGIPLFRNEGDVERVGAKAGAALDRIFDVAMRINRLTDSDMKELQGNSEGGNASDSGTPSPSPTAGVSEKPSTTSTPKNSPTGEPTTPSAPLASSVSTS